MISQEQKEIFIQEMEKMLFIEEKKGILLTKDWLEQFDVKAGVYALFEGDSICYIGETGCLKKRMRDMFDSRNHVIRRKLGSILFSDHKGYIKANASNKHDNQTEALIEDYMKAKMQLICLPILWGRKEFEEYITEKYKPVYNTRGQRK